MRVAGLQPQAEHGGEMANGIARMRVQHELWPRRRAGGKIEQHRIVGAGRPVRLKAGVRREQGGERPPSFRRCANRDALDVRANFGEFLGVRAVGDQEFRLAAGKTVLDVGGPERRHGGDQHQAELHRRQHRHPEFGRDAEHHQEPVAALRPEPAQAVGEPRGLARKLGEGARLDRLAEDLQRELPAVIAGREFGVEPFERPVELFRPRPDEGGLRGGIVVPQFQQEVARLAEGRRRNRCLGGRGEY